MCRDENCKEEEEEKCEHGRYLSHHYVCVLFLFFFFYLFVYLFTRLWRVVSFDMRDTGNGEEKTLLTVVTPKESFVRYKVKDQCL